MLSLKHFIFLFILFSVLLVSCRIEPHGNGKIKVIDLDELKNSNSSFGIEEMFELEDRVKLDFSTILPKFPIAKRIYNDSLLLVKSNKRIFSMNKNDGSLVTMIARSGNGPEEFYSVFKELDYFSRDDIFYALKSPNEIIRYNKDKTTTVFDVPEVSNLKGMEKGIVTGMAISPDKSITAYVMNMSGNEQYKLLTFDTTGSIIKKFVNHLSYTKKPGLFRFDAPIFHSYNDQLYFKEMYNDTIFKIENQNLIPAYVFKSSQLLPEYQDQDILTKEEKENLVLITGIYQDNDFLYFQFEYRNQKEFGLFSKSTGTTKFVRNTNSNSWLNGIVGAPMFMHEESLVYTLPHWLLLDLLSEEVIINEFGDSFMEQEQDPYLITLKKKAK